jgi:hypothetical protein
LARALARCMATVVGVIPSSYAISLLDILDASPALP